MVPVYGLEANNILIHGIRYMMNLADFDLYGRPLLSLKEVTVGSLWNHFVQD